MRYCILIFLTMIHISTLAQNSELKGDDKLNAKFKQLIEDKKIDFELIESTFDYYNTEYFKIDLDFWETQKYISANGDIRPIFQDTLIFQRTITEYKKLGLTSNGRIDLIVLLDMIENIDKPSQTTKLMIGAFRQLFVDTEMNFSVGTFSSLFTDAFKPKEIKHEVYKNIYIFITTLYLLNNNFYDETYE